MGGWRAFFRRYFVGFRAFLLGFIFKEHAAIGGVFMRSHFMTHLERREANLEKTKERKRQHKHLSISRV